MKRITANVLLMGFALSVYPQGYVALDNVFNTGTNDPAATASGLFWISTGGAPVLINQDFNASFYAGVTSNSLPLIASFRLSDGTAIHDNAVGPGTFIDPSGPFSYPIQGSTTSAFFQIQAWTGNFNSYAAAVVAGAPAAQSCVFINPVAVPPGTAPPLTGMPAIVLSVVPEPSIFTLAALAGVSALLPWRGRTKTGEKTHP
jgi:hypothetical protein